jgi:hypothetical protein
MASACGRAAGMAFARMLGQDGECEERRNGKTRKQWSHEILQGVGCRTTMLGIPAVLYGGGV